ncbi:MAG: peptidase, partial [Eudoraea sp.]|nr:peptidase [Eudoraea sp.]
VQHNINYRVLFHLMNLAGHHAVHPQVNAIAHLKLKDVRAALLTSKAEANAMEMVKRIDHFFDEPDKFKVIPVPKIPDGSPIGMDCFTPY